MNDVRRKKGYGVSSISSVLSPEPPFPGNSPDYGRQLSEGKFIGEDRSLRSCQAYSNASHFCYSFYEFSFKSCFSFNFDIMAIGSLHSISFNI